MHLSAPHVPARAQIRYDPLEKASKCSRAFQIKLSVGIHAVLHAQVRGLKKMQLIQNKDSTPIFSPQTTFNVSKGCCPSVSGRINTMLWAQWGHSFLTMTMGVARLQTDRASTVVKERGKHSSGAQPPQHLSLLLTDSLGWRRHLWVHWRDAVSFGEKAELRSLLLQSSTVSLTTDPLTWDTQLAASTSWGN